VTEINFSAAHLVESQLLNTLLASNEKKQATSQSKEHPDAFRRYLSESSDEGNVGDHESSTADMSLVDGFPSMQGDLESTTELSESSFMGRRPSETEDAHLAAALPSRSEYVAAVSSNPLASVVTEQSTDWAWRAHGHFDYARGSSQRLFSPIQESAIGLDLTKDEGMPVNKRGGNNALSTVDTRVITHARYEGAVFTRLISHALPKKHTMAERAQRVARTDPGMEYEKQVLRYNKKSAALVIRDYFSKKERVISQLDALKSMLGGMVKSITFNGLRIFSATGGKHGS